jgi:CubicO group peptidase (beta-lactamase class C family)
MLDDLRLERRVGAILSPWRDLKIPGVTIGIVRDGTLDLHRNAGLASLELDVPIGPDTAFRIASVSKQFTCAAILMLAEEGRLHVEDDSRAYLPELPDLGMSITIAHLMHNTSGIRDMLELMRQGGADLGQAITKGDLLEAICRQRGLNFSPGTRFLYSNSNFFLLGLIVERVSGQPLPAFLRERIFVPLGMTMTRMTESTLEPVPGLATGYVPGEAGSWRRAAHAFPLGGEGGLVSSVEDLALWARNMTTHLVGGKHLAAKLEETTPFMNGVVNGYARGLQVAVHRGVRTIGHGGLWPGFKTQFLRAPDRHSTVIVISNNGAADPYHIAHDVLDALLDGETGLHAAPRMPSRRELERYVGRWVDHASGYTAEISIEDDRIMGRTWGVPFRLNPTDDGRLIASRSARDFVAHAGADGDTLEVEADARFRSVFTRAPEAAALPADLPGRYSSDETAAAWTIAEPTEAAPDRMAISVAGPVVRASGMYVVPIDGDIVRVMTPRALFESWMDTRVIRDAAGVITGLRVDGGRARGLVYRRMD